MRSHQRLSYANIVSTLALIVAMSTGGAYAATLITTSQIADGAVTARKIAPNAVGREKLRDAAVGAPELAGGAVTGAKLAAGAVTGSKVAEATLTGGDILDGALGAVDLSQEARAPSAFAHVMWNGTIVDADPSHGLTADMIDTTDPSDGQYCISDLPFQPRTVAVGSTLHFSAPSVVTAEMGASGTCAIGTQVTVRTFDLGAHSQNAGSFQINLWP